MPCTTRPRCRRVRPRSIILAAVAAPWPSETRTAQTRVCTPATPKPLVPGVGAADPLAALAGGPITRSRALFRAEGWVLQAVPYSQSRWWTDANGTYRPDCSGYVAMARHLDQRVNYWTGNVATVSTRIPSASLRPGDILLLSGKHLVIFAGWAGNGNPTRRSVNVFDASRVFAVETPRGSPAERPPGGLDEPAAPST